MFWVRLDVSSRPWQTISSILTVIKSVSDLSALQCAKKPHHRLKTNERMNEQKREGKSHRSHNVETY